MAKGGFVFLWRKAKGSDVYGDILAWRVFEALFLDAKYKAETIEFSGQPVRLRRGQVAIGLRKYAEELGITVGQLREALKRLEFKYKTIKKEAKSTTRFTTHLTTHLCTVVTILKYNSYQSEKTSNNTESNTLYNTCTNNKNKKNKRTCRKSTSLKNKKPEKIKDLLPDVLVNSKGGGMVECESCKTIFDLSKTQECPTCHVEYPRTLDEEYERVKQNLKDGKYKFPWNEEEKSGKE